MENQTDPIARDPPTEFERLPKAVLATAAAIGGKWKIPVIWMLWLRPRRFGELRRALPGITQHMLTSTLRELERDGLISRKVFVEVPLRVEYALTEDSAELCDVFDAMQKWGARLTGEATGRGPKHLTPFRPRRFPA